MATIVAKLAPPTISGDGKPLATVDLSDVRRQLEDSGALLLRGFAVAPKDFRALGDGLCSGSMHNESPGRETIDDDPTIQSVNTGLDPFPLHPELAREPWRPDLAMFACLEPPEVGGQTNICDGIAIADNLPDDLRAELADKRFFFIKPASKPMLRYWLGTETPDDQLLKNPPPECPYWFRRAQGNILRGFTRPVLEPTLFQNRPAFANFLLFARDFLRIRHTPSIEGKPVSDDLVDTIRSIARRLTYSHVWQTGDVLLLDNSRFMHGRKAIADAKKRRIATYFGYLKGIDRRDSDPPNPVWRAGHFVPPELPDETRSGKEAGE